MRFNAIDAAPDLYGYGVPCADKSVVEDRIALCRGARVKVDSLGDDARTPWALKWGKGSRTRSFSAHVDPSHGADERTSPLWLPGQVESPSACSKSPPGKVCHLRTPQLVAAPLSLLRLRLLPRRWRRSGSSTSASGYAPRPC